MKTKEKSKTLYMGEKIIKAEKVLDKSYQRFCDNIADKEIDKLDIINLALRHSEEGVCAVLKKQLLRGINVDNYIYYYKPDNSYHSWKVPKEMLISDNPGIHTDCMAYEVGTHILTGKSIFAIQKDGALVFEHNGQVVTPYIAQNKGLMLDGNNLVVKKEYYRSGYNNKYQSVRYIINDSHIPEQSFISVLELAFPKSVSDCKSLNSNDADYEITTSKVILSKSNFLDKATQDRHNKEVYFKDGIFYFIINSGYIYHAVSIPGEEFDGINYCLLANTLFYKAKNTNGICLVHTEYTVPMDKYHVMFDEKYKLSFKETPFHKYGYIQEGAIIKDNVVYDLSNTETIPTTNNPVGDAYLITGKSNKNMIAIIRDNKVYIYHQKVTSYVPENILKQYSNLRYERRKSSFYKNKSGTEIMLNNGDDAMFYISEDIYDINSLKLISEDAATVRGLDGQLYCINNKGYKQIIDNMENYLEFSGDSNIAGFKKDGTIDINGLQMLFNESKGQLLYDNKVIWSNVKHDDFLTFTSYEPVENCRSKVSINFTNQSVPHITFDGRSYYCDDLFDYYRNTNGTFIHLKKEGITLSTDDTPYVTQMETQNKFIDFNKNYLVHGYFIQGGVLASIQRYNNTVFNAIVEDVVSHSFLSKDEIEAYINKSVIAKIIDHAGAYGIYLQEKDIENKENIKDILTVLLNLHNMEDKTKIPFDVLSGDIANFLKDPTYDFTESEYFKKINMSNRKNYMESGLSIDKFNNYSEQITFKSTTAKNRLQKESLSSSLYTQLYNLVGSKVKNAYGILRLMNAEQISEFALDNKEEIERYIHTLSFNEKTAAIKLLNEAGYSLNRFLKKYALSLDHTNLVISVNEQSSEKVTLKKYKQIATDLEETISKIVHTIKNSDINSKIKLEAVRYIEWSVQHIKDDFANLDIVTDSKEKTFTLKLWDRKDLITNLVQGTKTHCCIAADSYNIWALINYIYNENMALVELRTKDDVVGQAFVYIGVTNDKLTYRYEEKRHQFMIIDNMEINNNYTPYATDIAMHLQKFMTGYCEYVSKNISDVFLGTNYNDIQPPYSFTAYYNINIIGFNHYKDNDNKFYKFI